MGAAAIAGLVLTGVKMGVDADNQRKAGVVATNDALKTHAANQAADIMRTIPPPPAASIDTARSGTGPEVPV